MSVRRGSIPGRVIPKTQKMVLDPALRNTQHYKVGIKGKVEQSKGMEFRPPLYLGVVAIEKGAFGHPQLRSPTLLTLDLTRELKKLWNNKGKVMPIVIGALETISKGLVKGQRTSGDHPDYIIIKIEQNTEKSPGDLRSLSDSSERLSANAGVTARQ